MDATELSPQQQAQAIWDNIDAEERSQPAAAAASDAAQARQDPAQRPADSQSLQPPSPASKRPAQGSPEGEQGAASQPGGEDPAVDFETRLRGTESMLQAAVTRLRNAEGRIGDLKSQLAEALARNAQQPTAPTAPAAGQAAEPQGAVRKPPKALAKIKEDYPEIGAGVEETLQETFQEQEARIRAEVDRIVAERLRAFQPSQNLVTREELEARERENQIAMRYPDWKETVGKPAFHGWYEQQPPEVQLLSRSSSPRDAIRLLDLYSQASSAASNRTQRLASAAALQSSRSVASARVKPIEEMTPQEIWAYEDEQDRLKGS